MTLAETLFATPAMVACFSGEAHIRQILAFEAALARAEARAGVIPSSAADAIGAACQAASIDAAALHNAAVATGTLAIPVVRHLMGLIDGDARRFVHWGATSQDAIDTATVLQMRHGLDLLEAELRTLASTCAALAERHRRTPMAGRTLLQPAVPITFGLKAARWLGLAARSVEILRTCRAGALVVQLGGAAGTLASLGQRGLAVAELLGDELGLPVPPLPWHAERDRGAALAGALGVAAGAAGKIATDILLLAQAEVGEAAEGAVIGKGGSSTMPQKRNPVDAVEAVAAARLAIGLVPVLLGGMLQEHERAAGAWQSEWAALPDLFRYTAGAVGHTRAAVAGLEVDAERMRANLDLAGGLIAAESLSFALAGSIGRDCALALVQALAQRVRSEGTTLRDAALDDQTIRAALSADAIERALDPLTYLGSADLFIDRALAAYGAVGQ